jgi:hypothetical protein
MRLSDLEVNTLLLLLAYVLGHWRDLDDKEEDDLFQSAEMLRQRIQKTQKRHRLQSSAAFACKPMAGAQPAGQIQY